MSFFKKLKGKVTSSGERDTNAYWVYAKCNRCDEAIHTRVDILNDLSLNYDDQSGETTYFCRKYLMGGRRCFQQIEVTLTFDQSRHLIDRQISGGEFMSREEYLKSTGQTEDETES
jgi:hypothetical protein